MGGASLFGIWIYASNVLANYLIALSWESPTWKCESDQGVWKAFSRSAAARIAIPIEPKLDIFINDGKKAIVYGVVSTTMSML